MTEIEIVGGLLLSAAMIVTFGVLLMGLFVLGKACSKTRRVIPGSRRKE